MWFQKLCKIHILSRRYSPAPYESLGIKHLSHGSSVNFSGKTYNVVFYGVDSNGFIDYDDLENKIRYYQPKLILAGASAYSRIIDFDKIKKIINAVSLDRYIAFDEDYKPYFMVDMAHIAGLVAAGVHPSPFGIADIMAAVSM